MILNKFFILSFLITGLSGCLSYHDKTLRNNDSINQLTQLEKNKLIQQAALVHHDRLPPIKINFYKPFTVEELAVISVLVNPDLIALRAKERVAKAQVFDAGLLPDPQVGLLFDKTLHQTDPLTIPLSNGYGFSLSWDIAGLITRYAKVTIAAAKYQQVHYDVAWQEWLIANQAELLATRIYFLQQQVLLMEKNKLFVKRLLDVTYRNMQRHDAKIDEYALRQTAYLDLQDQLQTLQRTLKGTQLQLNQVLGLNPEEKVPLSYHKPNIKPHINAISLFKEARIYRLDLLALRAGYQSQEYTIYQSILGQFPHFNLGLTRGQDTGAVNTIGVNLSFDIPVFNRNRGVIAIAYATREQLNLEYKARLHQTQADIAALVADLNLIAQTEQILATALPRLRHAEQVMSEGLKTGSITEITYLSVLADLFNKELRLLALKQNGAEQMIALQIALGRLWNEASAHVNK